MGIRTRAASGGKGSRARNGTQPRAPRVAGGTGRSPCPTGPTGQFDQSFRARLTLPEGCGGGGCGASFPYSVALYTGKPPTKSPTSGISLACRTRHGKDPYELPEPPQCRGCASSGRYAVQSLNERPDTARPGGEAWCPAPRTKGRSPLVTYMPPGRRHGATACWHWSSRSADCLRSISRWMTATPSFSDRIHCRSAGGGLLRRSTWNWRNGCRSAVLARSGMPWQPGRQRKAQHRQRKRNTYRRKAGVIPNAKRNRIRSVSVWASSKDNYV